MALIRTLEDIARDLEAAGKRLDASPPANVSGEEAKVIGGLLRAAVLFRAGDEVSALDCLMQVRAEIGFSTLPIISNIVWLCGRLGREQEAAHACLDFGRDCFRMGYPDIGLEACSAAFILDSASTFELLRSPAHSRAAAELYEQVALSMPAGNAQPAVVPAAAGPATVAMIVPNIVDHVVAYTKTTLHFARYIDRARYRLRVYSTENSAEREEPLFPYGPQVYRSETTGRAAIAELRSLDVPVFISSRRTPFRERAADLIARLAADNVKIAVFQTSLACPVDWLVARLAPLPVKAAIHIGSSLFNRGLAMTFYDNPANIEREDAFWPANAGDRILLNMGTDLAELDAQPARSRIDFGIPSDGVVIGVLSNHLDRRMSPEYMQAIALVLRENPNAWFLALGSGPIPEKMSFFESAGVGGRVRFGGAQNKSGSALKALDIYANEFPVGGCCSVMEAMACELPIVAMRWSDAHAESAGAGLVGPPYAIKERNVEDYSRLLSKLVKDSAERRRMGNAMKDIARTRLSAGHYVSEVLARAESALR